MMLLMSHKEYSSDHQGDADQPRRDNLQFQHYPVIGFDPV
jgi:hypothetical protein